MGLNLRAPTIIASIALLFLSGTGGVMAQTGVIVVDASSTQLVGLRRPDTLITLGPTEATRVIVDAAQSLTRASVDTPPADFGQGPLARVIVDSAQSLTRASVDTPPTDFGQGPLARIKVSSAAALVSAGLNEPLLPVDPVVDTDGDGISDNIDGTYLGFTSPNVGQSSNGVVDQSTVISGAFTDRDLGGTTSGMVFDDMARRRNSAFIRAHPDNIGERAPQVIDAIVIHYCAGSFRSCIRTFRDPDSMVSAHYVINKQGVIVQMVRDDDRAFHATYYNDRSIGIELEGSGGAREFTTAMYESLANLIAKILTMHPTIPLDHPESIAAVGDCLNVPGIVGHEQIQPSSEVTLDCTGGLTSTVKIDPGPNFNWDLLMALTSVRLDDLATAPAAAIDDVSDLANGVSIRIIGGKGGKAGIIACGSVLQLEAEFFGEITCNP